MAKRKAATTTPQFCPACGADVDVGGYSTPRGDGYAVACIGDDCGMRGPLAASAAAASAKWNRIAFKRAGSAPRNSEP